MLSLERIKSILEKNNIEFRKNGYRSYYADLLKEHGLEPEIVDVNKIKKEREEYKTRILGEINEGAQDKIKNRIKEGHINNRYLRIKEREKKEREFKDKLKEIDDPYGRGKPEMIKLWRKIEESEIVEPEKKESEIVEPEKKEEIVEPEKREEIVEPEKKEDKKYERLKYIRKNPRKVILKDVNTGEIHKFPSIYKAGIFIGFCPQTILNWRERVWRDKYEITIL